MTVEIDITVGNVCVLPVLAGAGSQMLLTGPAYLLGWSLREASGDLDLYKEGSVTAPAALTNIASLSGVPAGKYTVEITVSLSGPAAAADGNNFQLQAPGGQTFPLQNLPVAGEYPQEPIVVTSTLSGAWNIRSVGAGTAAVIYTAQMTLIQEGEIVAVAELSDGNNPLGEIAAAANGVSNFSLGDSGVWVRNGILLTFISGTLQGAVYARYPYASA